MNSTPTAETTNNIPATLHDELIAEFTEQRLASGFAVAERVANPIPGLEAYLASDEDIYGKMAGTTTRPISRIERSMIDQAADRAGLRIEDGSRVAPDERGVLRWEVSENGIQTVRYNAVDTPFRAELQNVIDDYAAPFEEIAAQLREHTSPAISGHEFSLNEQHDNLDAVVLFMGLNLPGHSPTQLRAKVVEALYDLPVRLPGDQSDAYASAEGVYFDEDGTLIKILREVNGVPGVTKGMYFAPGTDKDPTETTFRLGVELHAQRYALSEGQRGNTEDTPFIESHTGQALVDAIEQAGLGVSDRLKKILFETRGGQEYDSRYGNGYAELTREIAKIVNDPRRLTEGTLFAEPPERVVDALQGIADEETIPESTRVVMDMLQQIGHRSAEGDRIAHDSDIAVELRGDGMKAGSCKDAEFYYLSDMKEGRTTVEPFGDANIPMLRKNTGADTAVNLAEVRYNGITLPPGCLFQVKRHEDGTRTFTFVRVTGFALDQPTAHDAFGWHYSEVRDHAGKSPSRESIAHLMAPTSRAA